ncbi:MAG: energy transducer TonB [Bacteroidia bacterium]|nr:energy transducer TonB [Bacteroidia bacterium]
MTKTITTLYLLMLALILAPSHVNGQHLDPVNVIIGDISYKASFGVEPTNESLEQDRIQAHLYYVETRLRKANVDHLTDQQKQNRNKVIDHLNAYWKANSFPSNYDYPGTRKPCFIDYQGKICAVGYLVEQTAGRAVAEAINNKFQYAYISEMEDEQLESWMDEHGLSRTECAMIQPTYEYEKKRIAIPPQSECRLPDDTSDAYIPIHDITMLDTAAKFNARAGIGYVDYIKRYMRYPEVAKEAGIEGTVFLRFVVTPHGGVCNVEMLRGVHPSLDKEAIRLIRGSVGGWTPGMWKGEAVYSFMTVPVKFRLE